MFATFDLSGVEASEDDIDDYTKSDVDDTIGTMYAIVEDVTDAIGTVAEEVDDALGVVVGDVAGAMDNMAEDVTGVLSDVPCTSVLDNGVIAEGDMATDSTQTTYLWTLRAYVVTSLAPLVRCVT